MHNLKLVKNENSVRLKDLLIEVIHDLKEQGYTQAQVLAHISNDSFVKAITLQSKIKKA